MKFSELTATIVADFLKENQFQSKFRRSPTSSEKWRSSLVDTDQYLLENEYVGEADENS